MNVNNEIIYKTPEEILSVHDKQEWIHLALSCDNLYAFYQSPDWWQYSLNVMLRDHILRLRYGGDPVIAQIVGNDGTLAGMTGAFASNYLLNFKFKSRTLSIFNISAIRLMGGQPLVKNDEAIYIELVKTLFEKFPNCDAIHIPWVPIGSNCWNNIHKSNELSQVAKVYVPDKDYAKHFSITLDQSFDGYLQKFNKKARYNLKREVKILDSHCHDQLCMVRIEQANDVKMFLDAAVKVSSKSWQHELEPQMDNSLDERRRYEQFANQGVLRCYLLRCGETACAFVRGFQFGGVYYYSRIGFDEKFKKFSPGKVLFYLMLEDLHSYNKPNRLNFQEGDYEYKRSFANSCIETADILLMRYDADIKSKTAIAVHKLFNSSVIYMKKILALKRA